MLLKVWVILIMELYLFSMLMTNLLSVTNFDKLRNLKLLLNLSENILGFSITNSKLESIWMGGSETRNLEVASIFNSRTTCFPLFFRYTD